MASGGGGGWFSDLKAFTDTVQSALPKIDNEAFLQSLTLTTPELTAERERIDAEEKRKEHVRNMLAGMFPWQTRDADREILVEECKEAILALSNDKTTFFGPYQMPRKEKGNEEEESLKPSPESLQKLAKLEPLPPLLAHFDLQSHVGLVERLLVEDPKLVKMQATLSGGGQRERIFWKNYFFHCAYTRYEAGLSIDEIWSEMTDEERLAVIAENAAHTNSTSEAATAAASSTSSSLTTAAVASSFGGMMEALSSQVSALTDQATGTTAVTATSAAPDEADETITFDNDVAVSGAVENAEATVASSLELFKPDGSVTNSKASAESEFEMVGDEKIIDGDRLGDDIDNVDAVGGGRDNDLDDSPLGDEDYELDELEAEIARELED